MRAVETLVGIVLLAGMLIAVDCLPKAIKTRTPSMCFPNATPAILCNEVTRDRKHECVVCLGHAISCETETGIFCVNSCDDVICVPR